ncbi:MAG TPA: preprotein translocase subunit TatB [Syntrophaceticus sp.]|nr:preprotein translocase subunit TatB [Syntrophaceticus sp.]
MKKLVDARGLSCPLPVLKTKEAIDKGEQEIEVLVDNNTALENVTRLAQSKGFKVTTSKSTDGDWQILINREK